MVDQLARPKEHAEVYWFSEQPYSAVSDEDIEPYEYGRLGFPNSHFDADKAHELYNQYHEQYSWADEVGFDGIMTNEHHGAYWCMKPSANLDAAVIAKVTKNVKIAILGNVIAVADPVRIAEQVAMLDCYSGGRIISGFVRGSPAETLLGGMSPTENRTASKRPTTLSSSAGPIPAPSGGKANTTSTVWSTPG